MCVHPKYILLSFVQTNQPCFDLFRFTAPHTLSPRCFCISFGSFLPSFLLFPFSYLFFFSPSLSPHSTPHTLLIGFGKSPPTLCTFILRLPTVSGIEKKHIDTPTIFSRTLSFFFLFFSVFSTRTRTHVHRRSLTHSLTHT